MHTVPEVDQVLSRLRGSEGHAITLSGQDAAWLLGEIEGGREAYSVLLQQKKELEQQVALKQRAIDDLSAIIRAKR